MKTANYLLGREALQAWRIALKQKQGEGKAIKYRVFKELKARRNESLALKARLDNLKARRTK